MKKYVAKWKGEKIILTKKDYKILLKRFNIENFQLIEGHYENEVTCSLCEKFIDNQCNGCTFNKLSGGHNFGCIGIVNQISEEIKVSNKYLHLCINNINFSSKHFVEASKLINHINELLLTEFQLVVNKK